MSDYTYAGSQFPFDDNAFWLPPEGPLLEDFNNEVDHSLTGHYQASLARDIPGSDSHQVSSNDLDSPLIGSHTAQPDDFDFHAAIGDWEESIVFDEVLSSYLDSQYANEESPVNSLNVTDVTISSTCRDDDPSLLSKDQEPGASMTIRNMATGPKESREPLQCPQRVAERELGIRPTCAGVKAKSMADVRRHLSRPPHLIFIELCPMCNENFLDKDVFDREHGDNGQFCDIIGSQSRGQRQWQQWRQICEQLKKLINPQNSIEQRYEGPSAELTNSDDLAPSLTPTSEYDISLERHDEVRHNMHPVTLDSDIGSTQIASPYEANIHRAGLNNPTFPYSSHTVAPVLLTEHSTEYLRSTYDSSSTFAPRFNATNNLWHFYSEAVPGPVEVQPATYSQELHALYTNSLSSIEEPLQSPSPTCTRSFSSSDVSVTPSCMADELRCHVEDCQVRFTGVYRRGNLRRHIRLVHTEAKYPCGVFGCDKTFNRQDARLKHHRKDHAEELPLLKPPLARKHFARS